MTANASSYFALLRNDSSSFEVGRQLGLEEIRVTLFNAPLTNGDLPIPVLLILWKERDHSLRRLSQRISFLFLSIRVCSNLRVLLPARLDVEVSV